MSDSIQKGRKVLIFTDDKVKSAYFITNYSAGIVKVKTTNGNIEYINTNLCFMTAEHASKVLETKRRWWINEIRNVKRELIKISSQPNLHNTPSNLYLERMGRGFTLAYMDSKRKLDYEYVFSLRKEIRKFKQFKDGYASSLKEIHNFAHHNSFFTNILKTLRKLWV